MRNIKLTLSYLGSSYSGWQNTRAGNSIEETLAAALEKILQHDVALQAASRTDAGVHAEGQVVNFFLRKDVPLDRLRYSLNNVLPKDIAVSAIEERPEDFHPTLGSKKKEYWYHLCTSFAQLPFHRETSWHFPYPLDLEAMRRAALHLLGAHDFSTFCNERPLWDRNPVCTLEKIDIVALENERVRIAVAGDHFLYKMMRNLAGTLAYVGCGKLSADEIPAILASKDRTRAGVTAPAHGLLLKQVYYD